MTNAYKYLIEAGGLEEESSYPYTGKRGECKFKPDRVAVRVVNFTEIPIDENQIAANLVGHGPLAGQKIIISSFIYLNEEKSLNQRLPLFKTRYVDYKFFKSRYHFPSLNKSLRLKVQNCQLLFSRTTPSHEVLVIR